MRYAALVSDYDGTLARDGIVDDETVAALERLKRSGRHLVLATGRQADVAAVFPRIGLFDRVVAENGAVLFRPDTGETRLLAPPADQSLVRRLRDRGVPVWDGKTVIAVEASHAATAAELVVELDLPVRVTLNRDSAMILPVGVDKGSGAIAALADLGVSPHDAVGVGDAENDLPLLDLCGLSVAVGDALPEVTERADLVTRGENGAGVRELIDRLLADDVPGRPGTAGRPPRERSTSGS
jgi:hypothetical protein